MVARSVPVVVVLFVFAFRVSTVLAAEVSHDQIRSLAVEAIRGGEIAFSPPWNKIVRGMLWVKPGGSASSDPMQFQLDFWSADEPLKEVFLSQLMIEIWKQYLFSRQSNQEIMRPYYAQMEQI